VQPEGHLHADAFRRLCDEVPAGRARQSKTPLPETSLRWCDRIGWAVRSLRPVCTK
jgi:hypothetical protein